METVRRRQRTHPDRETLPADSVSLTRIFTTRKEPDPGAMSPVPSSSPASQHWCRLGRREMAVMNRTTEVEKCFPLCQLHRIEASFAGCLMAFTFGLRTRLHSLAPLRNQLSCRIEGNGVNPAKSLCFFTISQ